MAVQSSKKSTRSKSKIPKANALMAKSSVKNVNLNAHRTNKCELNADQVAKAVKASFQALHNVLKEDKKTNLFEGEILPMYLLVSAIKTPYQHAKPLKIQMPEPFRPSDVEVSLVVKDLEKGWKVDHEPTVKFFQDVLQAHGVTSIREVIPLRQLRVEFKPYEARAKLAKRFDVILVDQRIAKFVPRYLGKAFYHTGKLPIPVNMEADDLSKEINQALATSTMSMSHNGTSSQVLVGYSSQSEDEVCKNVVAVCETIRHDFPGSFTNVRSLMLRFGTRSWAVPLYASYATRDSVALPAKSRRAQPLVDELSTLAPGWKVAVFPEGNVYKVKDSAYKRTALDLIESVEWDQKRRKRSVDSNEMMTEAGNTFFNDEEPINPKSPMKYQEIRRLSESKLENEARRAKKTVITKTVKKANVDDSSEDEGNVLEEEYMNELDVLEDTVGGTEII